MESSPTSELVTEGTLALIDMATKARGKAYESKRCGQFFTSSNGHERTPTGEKSFPCKYCKKYFSNSSHCRRHERTHTGEKPYTCKYCKKCFSEIVSWKQHERTHTGEKPYTCKYCKMCFSQITTCKRHERTHTGEKPYTCKYCKKCFISSSHCRRHERTHTGLKPYTCRHCKRCFNVSSNCRRHELTHTGITTSYTSGEHLKKSISPSSNWSAREEIHERDSSLKCKQHDQHHHDQLTRDLQEPATTYGAEKSDMFSLAEENSSQVESLTCWICQEEFSSKACLIQHYDDHMK